MPAKKKELTQEEEFDKALEGKTVQQLRMMQAEALADESEAKRFLVLLRQRSANMATTVGPEVEQEIIAAKYEWNKSVTWLKTIEMKLEGEFKDISGVHKF